MMSSVLKVLLVLVLSIGLARGVFLSLVLGGYYRELAERNKVKIEAITPTRGVIVDRIGKALAMNVEQNGRVVRFYPAGEVAAAVTGYLGEMDKEEIKNCPDCLTEMLSGKAGLEKMYEEKLRGVAGEVLVEETAQGEIQGELVREEALNGENLKTNIDLELQKQLFVALKETLVGDIKSGVGIVAKVSGEVLALISLPSYDPNLFVGGKRSDYGGDYKDAIDVVNDGKRLPLFNRAVSGEFAPGSVFKLVPAIAGLAEGKIDKNTLIADTGEIRIGEYRYGNWYLDKYGRTEGEINVERALARSNDIFFYRVGERLGVDVLSRWSDLLGLGKITGIDLPGEANGLVPTQYWKEKTLGEKWFLGDTYHLAIGQGNLQATPMQINRMTAAVVSGWKCTPRVVGKGQCEDLKLKGEQRQIVLSGMKGACSQGGTAYPLFKHEGKIYCKTGTAQHGGEDDLPHAWISVVVPKGADEKDWLVITVLIEAGGEGSAVAAPVAAQIMPYILDRMVKE